MKIGATIAISIALACAAAGCGGGGGGRGAGAVVGPVAKLGFVVQPTTTPAGAVINTALGVQVAIQDALGQTVSTVTGTVTIAIGSPGTGPGGGTLGGTKTVTATAGIATFADLTISALGTGYTLVATSATLTAATSAAFDVGAVPAADGLAHLDPTGAMDFTRASEPPNASAFNFAQSMAVDSVHHRLFVVDASNSRVLVFNLSANDDFAGVDRVADFVLGQPSFVTRTGATTQSGLDSPVAVAYDPMRDRLFVSDGSNRVLVYNTATIVNGMNAASVLGQADFTATNAPVSASGTALVQGLAYDATNDRLFVSDFGYRRVLIFNTAAISNGMDAVNVLGQPDFTSTNLGTTSSTFASPQGLAYDAANARLFVSDSNNSRVLVFSVAPGFMNGEAASFVLGQPSFTTTSNAIPFSASSTASCAGVAFDAANNRLFVVGQPNRVTVFNTTTITNGQDAVNVLGQPNFTSSAATTSRSGMNFPFGVAYDSAKSLLFVADGSNNRVLVFNGTAITNGMNASDGLGHLDAGVMNFAVSSEDDALSASTFNPSGVAIDSVRHRLFVAESAGNRVLVFNLSVMNTFAGVDRVADLVLGQPNFRSNVAATTAAGMRSPRQIAYDVTGDRLFVADSNNRRVLVFATSAITNGMNASFVLGQPDFMSSADTTSQSGMSRTRGAAYDSAGGRLFVAEANNRVLVFNAAPGSIANGMNAANVIGQPDFTTTTTTPVTATRTNNPLDVAFDAAGNRLFVADGSNNRVLIFATSAITNGMSATNVLGQPDFTSSAAATSQSGMSGPRGLALDAPHGRLFVADSSNNRALVFGTAAIANGMAAVSVLGQVDFASSASAATTRSSLHPNALAYDPIANRLYEGDGSNRRIMIFDVP